ncbi:hypothetical protein [Streptomyces sp. NBC_00829]|uniref:hypothetical protein n=1 Tax=Streptomyces sp. NBC_00829 TaxID=2903679 RepID=UPI0038656157|nr:hypothetical protein OG293_27535 [Streptomyces sp. NBC_00829]
MAIFMHATLTGVTTDQYDALNRELQSMSGDLFAGCLSHACVATGSGLEIYDIWESEEAMNTFTERMMPVAEKQGMIPGPGGGPEIRAVHNYWTPGMA